MSDTKYEYRLVWKRKGVSIRNRRFARLKSAERYLFLLGPEPWKYNGEQADSYVCCSGFQCGCGGMTRQKQFEKMSMDLPEIEFIRIEKRVVGAWEQLSQQNFNVKNTLKEKEADVLEEIPF